jgi:hypothetical protein
MAARANLVVKDRTTPTPSDRTFTPDGADANKVHVFTEKTGVPAGDARFTAQIRKTSDKVRSSLRLAVPVVQTQTIGGINTPVIVRTAYGEVSFTFSNLSTPQERADCVGMLANSLAATGQAMINDLLVNTTDIY